MFRAILRRFASKDPELYIDNSPLFYQYFCELIGKPRRPPAHILAFEVLYHISSDAMRKSNRYPGFPAMTEDYIIHKNISLLHFCMIYERLIYEETKDSMYQANLFVELCGRYIFERYLDLVEDLIDVPVTEFESALVEMLANDYSTLQKSVSCYCYNRPYIVLSQIPNYNAKSLIIKYC